MFTKEDAPSGYGVFQRLKEAADDRELPVLDSLPSDRMTRVRREALEAFAHKMLAEQDWPLPWFLFPEERPNRGRKGSGATSGAEWRCWRELTKLMIAGPQVKPKPDYRGDFPIGKNAFDRAWANALVDSKNPNGWGKPGPRPKSSGSEA